jgi:phosphoglucomutase/phosphomannomutase
MGNPCRPENLKDEQNKIAGIRQELEKTLMQYCYQLLDVDFPDRGFLLFWQLPLEDKLKYFEIEDEIVKLKNTSDTRARKAELDQLLLFLGANPIEKVDKAFKEKHGVGIVQYLKLSDVE